MSDEPDNFVPPTPERLRRAADLIENFKTESGRSTLRLLDGSVLDMLLSRGAITGDEYHAGARLYADWYYAGLAPGAIDPSTEQVDNSANTADADRQHDAMKRYEFAIQAVGIVHANVLCAVVLAEERLADYGRRRFAINDLDYARKQAGAVLKAALDQLDYHYHGKRRGIYRKSHALGYRPTIPEPDPDT